VRSKSDKESQLNLAHGTKNGKMQGTTKTSTSVFGDGLKSTHADPTCTGRP